MRKLIFVIAGLMFFAGFAIAQPTYKATTGDNVVSSKDRVNVEASTPTVVKTTYNLLSIDSEIQRLNAEIATRQTEIAAWEALRALVDAEAGKVILKP